MHLSTSGSLDIAIGYEALYNSTTSVDDTAIGYEALFSNKIAGDNTAVGFEALNSNDKNGSGQAYGNTALGSYALFVNTQRPIKLGRRYRGAFVKHPRQRQYCLWRVRLEG